MTTIHDATTDEIIAWCFDEEHPDWWDDLPAARSALADVIADLNAQFAAHKATFSEATRHHLPPAEYRAVLAEYEDWKRRTTYIKTAVEERLRDVKAAHADQEREAARKVNPEDLIYRARRLHADLAAFLDSIDNPTTEGA